MYQSKKKKKIKSITSSSSSFKKKFLSSPNSRLYGAFAKISSNKIETKDNTVFCVIIVAVKKKVESLNRNHNEYFTSQMV